MYMASYGTTTAPADRADRHGLVDQARRPVIGASSDEQARAIVMPLLGHRVVLVSVKTPSLVRYREDKGRGDRVEGGAVSVPVSPPMAR